MIPLEVSYPVRPGGFCVVQELHDGVTHFMKIIHVDDNKFTRHEIQEQIPKFVSEVELQCFDYPDRALKFALDQGCDVMLTEIELWLERLGGIWLAMVCTNEYYTLSCPGVFI